MMISLGLSRNYLPDWDYQDALREIFQNFEDYGEYALEQVCMGDSYEVSMSSDWSPSDLSFLRIGESGKRNDSTTRGQHGEGLKMAGLIFAKEDIDFRIATCGKSIGFVWEEVEFLGEVLHLDIEDGVTSGFTLSFTVPVDEFDEFYDSMCREDVIFEHERGNILDKGDGNIYCGGLFVCNLPNLRRSYDFKPQYITLDRDRKIPSSWDVQYNVGLILSDYDLTTKEDLVGGYGSYINTVSLDVAQSFKPIKGEKGVLLQSGDVVVAQGSSAHDALLKHPIIQKRVTKMKYEMRRKLKPESVLRELYSKFGFMTNELRTDFLAVIKQSKKWDNK